MMHPTHGRHVTVVLLTLTAMAAALSTPVLAQQAAPTRQTGPVIDKFGATFAVPEGSVMPPRDGDYRVKFDVATSASDPSAVNPGIESVARFLNMQVRAGVPATQMKLALIVHGSAGRDLLGHAGYKKRHGVDNPNLPLLDALDRAGVRIYLCGQTAAGRGLGWDEIAPVAKVALSAMTAHAMLAREGYSTNPF